jgi:hypothetical protein
MKVVHWSGARPRRSAESGYAYLMALFMVLAMIAGSVVVIGNALTQSKRQREEEAIWRGNQYVRAIRLYFHKTGHYPQNIDELRKGLPQLHFLRQAYKDPMNKTDGTWRFVYINAAGQLIGSTRYASLQQMALIENPSLMAQAQGIPQLGVSAASLGSATNNLGAFGAQPSTPQPSGGQNPATGAPDTTAGAPQNPPDQSGQPPTPPANPPGQLGQSSFGSGGQLGNPILQQKPTGAVDGPVLGGFLTGVGGKSEEASLKVLHGGKKYKDWEFIWNPLEDQAAAMQQGLAGAGQLGQPGIGAAPGGASPFGGVNPFGGGPQPTPQNPPQNQPQTTPQ